MAHPWKSVKTSFGYYMVFLLLGCPVHVRAQPPGGGGGSGPPGGGGGGGSTSLCDACGGSATYAEVIDTSGSVATRTITSTGCPNHYSVCTGKSDVPSCGDIGEEGTATEAAIQDKTYVVPANPVIASSTTDVECEMGELGIALNGVSVYGGAVDTDCAIVDVEDETSEWTSFDMCSGHSERGGDYHYHFPPSCLLAQAVLESPVVDGGHSPQLGWAKDGFPIYGPLYSNGVPVTHDMLDGCGGIQEELSAVDDFKYRYYFMGNTSNLRALPTYPMPAAEDYPFFFTCLVGCSYDDLVDGSCTGTDGYSSSYTATEATGYTEVFSDYGPSDSTNFWGDTSSSSFINGSVCKSKNTSGKSNDDFFFGTILIFVIIAIVVIAVLCGCGYAVSKVQQREKKPSPRRGGQEKVGSNQGGSEVNSNPARGLLL